MNVALALVHVQGELRTPVLLGEVAMGSHDLFRYRVQISCQVVLSDCECCILALICAAVPQYGDRLL